MMQGGRLRHRVAIYSKTATQNSFGEEVITWTLFGTYWAAVEPLQGREMLEARTDTAELTVRIRMRYISGITPEMRAIWGSNTYDILTVTDIKSMQREQHLMCHQVVM